MDEIKSKTKKLHELGIQQVKCIDDYFNKMIELERILSECRINVAMAKTQNGFALSSVGFIDKRDMEATAFVNLDKDNGIFELVHPEIVEEKKEENESKTDVRKRGGKKTKAEKENEKAADDHNDKQEEKKKENVRRPLIPQFRPFGLLEPRSAKQARVKADEAIQRVCELSTIQSKIFSLEKSISHLNAEVIETLGEEYQNVVKINETSKPADSVKKLLKEVKWLELPAAILL